MSHHAENEFKFIWEIENFNVCVLLGDSGFKSPEFKADTLKETSWYLNIYVKKQNGRDIFSCFLHKLQNGKEEISINLKFVVLDAKGEVLQYRYGGIYTFSETHLSCGFKEYFKLDNLENLRKCLNEELITIQCIMSLQEHAVELASQCKAQTRICVDRSCFWWNVKEIDSPEWKSRKIFPCSPEASFEIILTVNGDNIRIIVKRLAKKNSESQHVSLQISLLNINQINRVTKKSEHIFDVNDIWEFPSFLEKNIFQDEKNKFLKNGSFTLLFEFAVSNGESFDCIGYSNKYLVSLNCNSVESTSTLLQDFKQMYTEHLQTDVNLHAEKQTFQAHKSVLSARSPVFAAMFNGNMLENQTGVVDIPDVEDKILDYFLIFLYTGDVDKLDYEFASKLLILADKYQVLSLKKKCSNFLMSNLSIANVCDVVMVAGMIEHDELITHAMNFIAAHSDIILKSDEWSRCIQNNIKLATDILCKVSVIMSTK